jgi:hypothetical protein
LHGNLTNDDTKGLLQEFQNALQKGGMQFKLKRALEVPEQRLFKVDNAFISVENSLNPSESNNATAVSFQKGPSNDTDRALMDAMSSYTDDKA